VRIRTTVAAMAAVALLVPIAGCGDDNNKTNATTSTTSTTSKTEGAPGAAATFVSPNDGSTEGSTFTARVKLSNFTLAPSKVGMAAKEGEGHLHFALDGGKYDQPKYSGANGKLAVKLGVQGKYSPSVAPTITYRQIPPGEHELEVYLANNDHTDTGVEAKTSFTVK
jgi:hypothetical protein